VAGFAEKYGPVFVITSLVSIRPDCGTAANEFVLLDQAQLFSAKDGWHPLIERLFPGSLLVFDFEEHRLNRKVLCNRCCVPTLYAVA
jgi:hypothetical protein